MFRLFKESSGKKNTINMFDVLANNSSDIYILFSPEDFSVSYVSPNVESVLGLTVEEVLYDIHVLWRTSEEEASYPTAEEIRMIKGDKTYSREFSRIHKITKESKYFKETVHALNVSGKEQLLAVLSDRTREAREVQVLRHDLYIRRSQSRVRKDFMFNMVREMLTPMNTMKGLISLLDIDAEAQPNVKPRVQQLESTYNHLRGTINNLMDMNHIVRVNEELYMTEFSAYDLIRESIEKHSDRIKAKKLTVTCKTVPLHKVYLGPEKSMETALSRIFSNAIDCAFENGRIDMTLELQKADVQDGYAKAVIGIKYLCKYLNDPSLLKLDKPIRKEDIELDKDYDPETALNVCKYLVEAIGGEFNVQKSLVDGISLEVIGDFLIIEEEKGSPMEFELAYAEEIIEDKVQEKQDNYSIKGTKILMAEDNELNAEILQELLELEGAECDRVENGKEALSKFLTTTRADAYDVIIMDIQMPIMDGYEAATAIRESAHPDAKLIPIIAITANVLESDIERTINAGMNAHLPKPVDVKRIKEIIHYYINK